MDVIIEGCYFKLRKADCFKIKAIIGRRRLKYIVRVSKIYIRKINVKKNKGIKIIIIRNKI